MHRRIRFLLLQVRNAADPIRRQEVECFARVLDVPVDQIGVCDLLGAVLSAHAIAQADMFLLGGSGHYSVVGEADWLNRALDALRSVHASRKPVFASCWGFQAMARALGGRVIKDLARAELGTHRLMLTDAGKVDPIFGPLGTSFDGQMGHEDHVVALPANATLLASSERVENQAYRFDDAPIYCTQFHPELNCSDLLRRALAYPEYIARIAGVPAEQFGEMIWETPAAAALLPRFVKTMFDP